MAMTLKKLNQYRAIRNEIPDLKARVREKQKEVNGHITVKGSMSESPYIARSIHVDDPGSMEDMRETLAIMQRRLRRITLQRRQIEKFIDNIPDSQLRQVFQYRFVDGFTWVKVSIKIGGGNSDKALKEKVYRYLKFDGKCGKKPC